MTPDTSHKDAPVCPHCGHVDPEAWNNGSTRDQDDDIEADCERCGRTYIAVRRVTYSTRKM